MLNTNFLTGMEDFVSKKPAQEASSMDIVRVTTEYIEPSRSAKNYCPVFCDVFPDNRRKFTAYLTGEVRDVNNYVDLLDVLMTATESDEITIYIDSPGGLIAAGGLIASAIDHCAGSVKTIARGFCASAAALIHSAAKPGYATVTPFALMLYHMSSHCDQGVSTMIRSRADAQVKYVNEVLLKKALNDGHITQDEFDRIQTGENILVSGPEWVKRTNKDQ